MEPTPIDNRSGRRLLVIVASLFFVPLGFAIYLFYGHPALRPGGMVNHGALIQPPRPLPALTLPLFGAGSTQPGFLRGKWTMLYVGSGVCGDRCRAALYETRQVRTALNRDMHRVQRVFLATGECCDAAFLHDQHPDLITVRATAAAAPLLASLPHAAGVDAAGAGRVYLVDPNGNLMMFYAPGAKPKGMLEDLQRLLQLSYIG